MKPEYKTLLDRIHQFGDMGSIDEYGSYIDHEVEKLSLALTKEEFRELCRIEEERQRNAAVA